MFLTGRVLPAMVGLEARVDDDDDRLTLFNNVDGRSVDVDLARVVERNDVRVAKCVVV